MTVSTLLLLVGCDVLDDLPDILLGTGDFSTETFKDTSNNAGLLKVKVDVDADTTGLLITGESDQHVSLERILDPDGNPVLKWDDWYYTPYSLTYAIFGFNTATAANWPIRAEDGPLRKGAWVFELATLDSSGYYAPSTKMDITVQRKKDADFSRGDVKVQITWADGVDEDQDIVDGVALAVEHWRTVWADAGLTLVESYASSDLDPSLGFADSGSEDLIPVAELKPPEALLMVIGEDINGKTGTFGIAGGIPGSVAPTRMTYVVISWLAHAGANGTVDDGEAALMGETMAHEAGHFTGLFHPVEFGLSAWDALADTDDCVDYVDCEIAIGHNNMYPYPICDYYGDGGCEPQNEYTPDQAGVMNRYTPVL